jgi:cellulose synthase/poly-beta-1,6-N-acetylglucosamine synthase-like glycosyltransferase
MVELNKAFDTGAGVVVGYRNTKNFDRNIISSGYGIHFYQSVVTYHRPRAWLHTPTHIAGTGFVVASRLLKNGWHYTCLTEDTQFTMNIVADGEFIAFCEDAEFFDEQPYEVRVMIRQRIRWIRGRWYSFFSTIPKLFKGIGKGGKRAFACYDMFVYCFPGSTYYAFLQIIFPFLRWATLFLIGLFATQSTGIGSSGSSQPFYLIVGGAIWSVILSKSSEYVKSAVKSALIVIRERKRIRCSTGKLIFYTLLAPWFDMVGAPLSVLALFSSSKWKPIKHDAAISIDELAK